VLEAVPPWQALQALLTCLGELRDFDVALTDTLPPLADAYREGDARRTEAWQAMTQALMHAARLQRKTVRYALQEPTVGAALLATTQWLEGLTVLKGQGDATLAPKVPLRRWARRRIVRLHERLQRACRQADTLARQHRARILAKRLRYGIEALRALLPKKRTQRWYQKATNLQTSLGAARDVMQAAVLAGRLEADRGVVEFLRGVATGQTRTT
jgi:CHAD domain-containing protein